MTASRGWWVHGALARLQVLLGGMVICHIRFSTTPDTMVVVYIGLRFFPYEIAFHHFAMEHAFLVRPYLHCLLKCGLPIESASNASFFSAKPRTPASRKDAMRTTQRTRPLRLWLLPFDQRHP